MSTYFWKHAPGTVDCETVDQNCADLQQKLERAESEVERLFGLYEQSLKTNQEQAKHCAEQRKEIEQLKKMDLIVRDVSGNRLQLWTDACKERDSLRAACERLAAVLERTKKLAMGPSMELQDSIMFDVFGALRAYAQTKKCCYCGVAFTTEFHCDDGCPKKTEGRKAL